MEVIFRKPWLETSICCAASRQANWLDRGLSNETLLFRYNIEIRSVQCVNFITGIECHPLIPLKDLELGKESPILKWNGSSLLAVLFPKVLVLLSFRNSNGSLTYEKERNTPLETRYQAIQWATGDFLILSSQRRFSVYSSSSLDCLFSRHHSAAQSIDLCVKDGTEPLVTLANGRFLETYSRDLVQPSTFINDSPIAKLHCHSNGKLYAIGMSGELKLIEDRERLSLEESPVASLLSIRTIPEVSSPPTTHVTGLSFSTNPIVPLYSLQWPKATVSPPRSISLSVAHPSLPLLVFANATSSTIYLWRLDRTQTGTMDIEALNLSPHTNARILGLFFPPTKTNHDSHVEMDKIGVRLLALVGNLEADPSLHLALSSHVEYHNVEIVTVEISQQPLTSDSNAIGLGSSASISSPLLDLKSQLLQLAVEDHQLETEEPYTVIEEIRTVRVNNVPMLQRILEGMASLHAKMDSLMEGQRVLEQRVTQISEQISSERCDCKRKDA